MNSGQIKKSKAAERYTIVPNEIIQSKDLTLEEKGLLSYLLSLPTDWVLFKEGLYKILPDQRGTIDRIFKGLQAKKYIISTKTVNEKGQFVGWEHIVYDSPTLANVEVGLNTKPTLPFAEVGESAPKQSTDSEQSTKEQNTNGDKPPQPTGKKDNYTPEEKLYFVKVDFCRLIIQFVKKNPGKYPKTMYVEFARHWLEETQNGKTKLRFQAEKFFNMGKRLHTWFGNTQDSKLSGYWEAEKTTPGLNVQLAELIKNEN